MHFLRKLKYILQSRYFLKLLSLTLIIISLIYSNYYTYKSKYNKNDTTFTGVVDSYELKEDKLVLTIIGKEKIEGKLKEPSSTTIFNTFDYQKYL